MKLLTAWMWESLENLPLLCGFVIAARLWESNLFAGLAALVIGMGLGVLITRSVEPKLHKIKYQVRWVSVVINFLLFLFLAVVFVYYFRADIPWLNWKTDILGGLAAGLLLTFVQSTHWSGPQSRMVLHGAAMMSAFPLIMLGLRTVIYQENWAFCLLSIVLLTLFASMMIAVIDYQELYRT